METKEIIKHALKDYQNITGLRSYVVYDNTVIQSASEKNYFCKCLKSSSKALKTCEECTEETYENARKIDHIPVMQVSSNGRYRYSVEISTVLSSVKVFSP